jgi:hypothetical protein
VAQYGDVDVFCSSFRPMKATISGSPVRTFVKILVDAATDKVVGMHMCGEDGPEIMQVRADAPRGCRSSRVLAGCLLSVEGIRYIRQSFTCSGRGMSTSCHAGQATQKRGVLNPLRSSKQSIRRLYTRCWSPLMLQGLLPCLVNLRCVCAWDVRRLTLQTTFVGVCCGNPDWSHQERH